MWPWRIGTAGPQLRVQEDRRYRSLQRPRCVHVTVYPLDSEGERIGSGIPFTVTFATGSYYAYSTYIDVPVSAYGYEYDEVAALGYTGAGDGFVDALANCATETEEVNDARDLGDLVITKTWSGDPTGAVVDSITVDVVCTPGTYAWTDLELTAEDNWTVTLTGIRPGCPARSPRTRSPVGRPASARRR